MDDFTTSCDSLPDPAALLSEAGACFGPDVPLLQARLRRLRKQVRASAPQARVEDPASWPLPLREQLRQVVGKLRQSRAFARWREENLPKPEYPEGLPVSQKRGEIAELIRAHQVVILAGETGSGKTTQLPKICLELGRGVRGLIGCTQPRRVAAVSVAERVAAELSTPLGAAVGYQVRFDGKRAKETYVMFMTDGILLSQTRGDPDLLEYDTLIIDEAHERSLNIDFILGYLQRLLPRRPDLKVIISSATLEVDRFSAYFSGAPVMRIEGRTYPVDIQYHPLPEEDAELPVWVGHTLEKLYHEHGEGDALVFLTGEQEIRETVLHLQKRNLRGVEVLPLYSRLSPAEQRLVFHPGTARRIVVTTNVAETSVTVPRVRYVIDSGLARIKRYNARTQMESLQAEVISQASANQRAGRCGRVGPGICARLYSEEDFASRPDYTDPEIKRSSLAGVILQMELLRLGRVEEFPFIEPPAPALIRSGYDELDELGAFQTREDGTRQLTRDGKRIASLPVEPRYGRMLLAAAERGVLREAAVIVAALGVQDPRLRPAEKKEAADRAHGKFRDKLSDFKTWLHLWRELERREEEEGSNNRFARWCRENFLSYMRIREWRSAVRQLQDIIRSTQFMRGAEADTPAAPSAASAATAPAPYRGKKLKLGKGESLEDIELHKALLCGLLSRCGKYHEDDREYRGARDTRFVIWPGSGLSGGRPAWLMSAEIVETSRAFARCCAVIDPVWLEELAPHLLKYTYSDPHFDENDGFVRAYQTATLYGLPVIEKRRIHYGAIDPVKARAVFIRDALAGRKMVSNLPFYRENCRLITKLEDEQHKLRRRDLVADEEVIAAFYEQRLPKDVHSLKQLERYCHSREGAGGRNLYLREEDIALEGGGGLSRKLFPPVFEQGALRLSLNYRFEPGHPEDGVSCAVPAGMLAGLDAAAFEWLVPGLLGEKVALLIRSLPRSLRKEFNPVPEAVEACLAQLGQPAGSFYERLAQCLSQLAPVRVSASDLRPDELPPFLRMHFKIIDAAGKTIAHGRDLRQLQKDCRQQATESFSQAPKEKFERMGLKAWGELTLPEQLTLPGGAAGYPGLADAGAAVDLRVFPTARQAENASRRGVCRLARLELEAQCRKIAKSLPLASAAQMYFAAIGGSAETLRDDILDAGLLHLFQAAPALPRDRAAFESFLNEARTRLYELANTAASAASQALLRASELQSALRAGGVLSPNQKAARDEIAMQFAALVHPGFAREAGIEHMPHIARYVQGLLLRLQKAQTAAPKDRERAKTINPLWERCRSGFLRAQKQRQANPALGQYRWLLEEYAVSLFAQELGTPQPISPKRLDEQWAAVEEGWKTSV